MATVKSRLARLGRPKRTISIEVGKETVEVVYQKPSVAMNERLIESIKGSLFQTLANLKTPTESKSVEQQYVDIFALLPREAILAEILEMESDRLASEAMNQMSSLMAEPQTQDWLEGNAEIVGKMLDGLKTSLANMSDDDLRKAAVNRRLVHLATTKCYSDYMVHLIHLSIYESEDSENTMFESTTDVVESLSPQTIVALGNSISREFVTTD